MKALNGKSREQIEVLLSKETRAGLLDIIASLATVEQHMTPAEIAARSCMSAKTVLRDIRAGRLRPFFKRTETRITVPLSAVNRWRSGFCIGA